jgi:NAD(P)-dependent dehydrogenase (short-subunit alcohol dehydrogenase family)
MPLRSPSALLRAILRQSKPEDTMDLNIGGLRVLVTAGAAGIGREIARAFIEEGARVHVCDVDAEALAALAHTDPAITRTLADVSQRPTVRSLFDETIAALGGLDVLVNNAGIAGPTGRVEEIHPEDWDRCVDICLTGQFNCTRLAVPYLKQSANASIVNLSSVAGRFGFSMRTPYAAAKWGVIGFTKSLAIELGEFGIRVNAILPGLVDGDRIRRVLEGKAQAMGRSFAETQDEALANVSLHTMVTARQLADQILFLCSPRGRTISGQALSICGDTQKLV